MMKNRPAVSVICPFYNEASIIENSIRNLAENLSRLSCEWELVVVNDGSTDGSWEIARRVAAENPRIRVMGYRHNKGRGAALHTGIHGSLGETIVTTEIDLSWGENIVHDLLQAMSEHLDADIIVASPHLEGGGYKNVPAKRVWLSRLGNKVIRACMSGAATMNTGMTRAYRRSSITSLPLYEAGKEFHLEVILKANAFGYRIYEIPAVLEWKDYKHAGKRVKRKSSTRVNRLIVTHSLFSLLATPVRYIWALGLASFAAGLVFFALAVVFYLTRQVSAIAAIVSLLLFLVSFVLIVAGIVFKQGHMIQRELWLLQSGLLLRSQERSSLEGDAREAAPQEALIHAVPKGKRSEL